MEIDPEELRLWFRMAIVSNETGYPRSSNTHSDTSPALYHGLLTGNAAKLARGYSASSDDTVILALGTRFTVSGIKAKLLIA
jgi:hypothetical protein